MTHLLDGNVLVALVVADHVHHAAARRWLEANRPQPFATCPITQGTLLRLLLREGRTAAQAWTVLTGVAEDDGHEAWADDIAYADVPVRGVVGHRQVTDAYLAQLARHRGGGLATLDRGLGALHPDVAVLVPTS